MPHVYEFHAASRAAAVVALAAAVLSGCTDTQRKVPLLAVPGVHDMPHAAAPRTAPVPATGAGAFAGFGSDDALPLATTGVSIGASRRT